MQPQRLEDESTRPTSIVVPCYNEAGRLDVDAFVEFVDSRPWLELVFVDDGSTDDTAAVIDTARQRAPERIRCLQLAANSGKAEAVRRGIVDAIASGARLVGFWDADLATPLREIDDFRARFEHQPDLRILMGSRVKLMGRDIQRSFVRHYFGRIAATAVAGILTIPVYDTQCGAKMFRVDADVQELFARPFLTRWAFDVEILARWLIHRGPGVDVHRAILEVPLRQWTDVPQSKLKPRDFVLAPVDLWRIWRHYGVRIRERARQEAGAGRPG